MSLFQVEDPVQFEKVKKVPFLLILRIPPLACRVIPLSMRTAMIRPVKLQIVACVDCEVKGHT